MKETNENSNQEKLSFKLKELLKVKKIPEKVENDLDLIQSDFNKQVGEAFQEESSHFQINQDLKTEYQKQLNLIINHQINAVRDEFQRRKDFKNIHENRHYMKKRLNDQFLSSVSRIQQTIEKATQEEKQKLTEQEFEAFSMELEQINTEFIKQIEEKKQKSQYFRRSTKKLFEQVIKSEQLGVFLHLKQIYNSEKNCESNSFPLLLNKSIQNSDKYLELLKQLTEKNNQFYFNKYKSYDLERENRENQLKKVVQDKSLWKDFVTWIMPKKEDHQNKKINNNAQNETAKSQIYHSIVNELYEEDLMTKGMMAFKEIKELVLSCCEKIQNSSNLDISFLSGMLREIQDKISKSEKHYLSDVQIYFKKEGIEQHVSDALFYSITQSYLNNQEEQIKLEKKEFELEINEHKKIFKSKLNSFLGDQQSAMHEKEKITIQFEKDIKERYQDKFQEDLELSTKLPTENLIERADSQIIEAFKKALLDISDFKKWATNNTEYLQKQYCLYFEKRKNDTIQSINQTMTDYCKDYFRKIDNYFERIEGLFQITDEGFTQSNSITDEEGTLNYKLFIALLTDYNQILVIHQQIKAKNYFSNLNLDKVNSEKNFIINNKFDQKKLFGEHQDNSKIENIQLFIQTLRQCLLKYQSIDLEIMKTNLMKEIAKNAKINQILTNNQNDSLACKEVCPYCGSKCSDNNIDQNHKHHSKRHRIMGLRGSHKSVNGQIILLDLCCSEPEAQKSLWKDNVAQVGKQSIDANARECLDQDALAQLKQQNCNLGVLNFTLSWHDPNDLDLFVTCPCGAYIGLGSKCECCKGVSDLDMNCSVFDAYKPAEHITYNDPKPGNYKIRVRFWSQRNYSGVQGGTSSKLKVQVHQGERSVLQSYEKTITKESEFNETFCYSPNLTFQEHCNKYYNSWLISAGDKINGELYQKCLEMVKKYSEAIKQETNLVSK